MRVAALGEAKRQSRRGLPWQGQPMRSEAHVTRARIAYSSLMAGIGDRFVKIVPAVPDEFVAPGAAALMALYGIALFFYLLPFSLWEPYFGFLMLICFTLITRNALAESRAEKARQHEHGHDAERDES